MEAVRQLSASISSWPFQTAAFAALSDRRAGNNVCTLLPSPSSSGGDAQFLLGARNVPAAGVRCASCKREKSSTTARPSSSSSPGGGFGAKTNPKPRRLQKYHEGGGRIFIPATALETRENASIAETSEDSFRKIQTDRDESATLTRQRLFNRIAPVYDNLNDWLSLGLHRVWKRMSVSWSGAKAGDRALDICCGSGDLSFLLAEKVGSEGQVSGLDFAAEQLSVAASRQDNSPRPRSARVEWIQGDALALPFEDGSFDAITMGYGLRNVASIPQALAEIHRVLKSGRKAAILDFNRSPDPLTDSVQSWMLDNVVVPVATYLGVQEEYAYLKTSIARFPLGREQEKLALGAGFSRAVHYELGGGLMGVLVVTKETKI